MGDRVYASLAELIGDLEIPGLGLRAELRLYDRLLAASEFVEKRAKGEFIPVTETRRFDTQGGKDAWIDPLLAATSVVDDTITLTSADYLLYPRNRHWASGPYTRIGIDPDATALAAFSRERDALVIAGRWGKYEASLATGATVNNATQIAAGGTSLLVANGALISPGMVLLIESEQLLVQARAATLTDTTATTSEALDETETGLDLSDGTKVNAGEVIRADSEEMLVELVATNTATVVRGYNDTLKATHTTSTAIYAYRTYTVKRGVNGTTDAAHLNGVAISRYVPPSDVNWLVRQIAGLMYKKARTGFVGKTANAELDEVFYVDEFPKKQLTEVINNYRITSL